jgi:hypothetical protein
MTKDEALALDLALAALEANQPVNYCLNSKGEKFPMLPEDPFKFERNAEAIIAIKQVRALDRKAENARELGLDYEPVQEPWKYRRWNDEAEKWELTDDCGWPSEPVYTTPPAAQPAPVYVKTFHGGKPWPLHPAPVQEPFCFVYVENGEEYFAPKGAYIPDNAQPLYTTPPTEPAPVQKPMHPEIKKMYEDYFDKCFKETVDLALGTTPPAQRTWVDLTDEAIWSEYQTLWPFHPAEEPRLAKDIAKFARAVLAKSKEKNT